MQAQAVLNTLLTTMSPPELSALLKFSVLEAQHVHTHLPGDGGEHIYKARTPYGEIHIAVYVSCGQIAATSY